MKPMQLADAAVLNLFCRFDPVAWGRGVATEAVTAVVGWTGRARPGQRLVAVSGQVTPPPRGWPPKPA